MPLIQKKDSKQNTINWKLLNLKNDPKDKAFEMKERAYRAFIDSINKSNNVKTPGTANLRLMKGDAAAQPVHKAKYLIGKGNNSILVRMCFKHRWWWTNGDWEDYNFAWTQWRSKKVLNTLPKCLENKHPGRGLTSAESS